MTFRDNFKKKPPKDPFNHEDLQKVLKTMSSEMVDIKKQVAETSSKKSFRPFERSSPADPKPPNAISNVESDGEDDEVLRNKEQIDDEEVA